MDAGADPHRVPSAVTLLARPHAAPVACPALRTETNKRQGYQCSTHTRPLLAHPPCAARCSCPPLGTWTCPAWRWQTPRQRPGHGTWEQGPQYGTPCLCTENVTAGIWPIHSGKLCQGQYVFAGWCGTCGGAREGEAPQHIACRSSLPGPLSLLQAPCAKLEPLPRTPPLTPQPLANRTAPDGPASDSKKRSCAIYTLPFVPMPPLFSGRALLGL